MNVSEFMTFMVSKVNALVASNDRRANPWNRKEFMRYIQGACDLFKYTSGEDFDTEDVACNIFIESTIMCEIEPMK